MNINDFSGAKVAILTKDHVLTLQRDNVPDIPFPNLWDLPGGGRENDETAIDCVIRETFEEVKLRLAPSDLSWRRIYPNARPGGLAHWFFVATPGWLTLPPPRLGNEGQDVRWMRLDAFIDMDGAIGHLQDRLKEYLSETSMPTASGL